MHSESGYRVLIPVHDIDLLTAQLFHDSIDAGTIHTYTGADSIYIGVIAPYSDLGTASCLSGNALDLYGTVLDLGNFGLEQSLYQFRMGTADIDAGSFGVFFTSTM